MGVDVKAGEGWGQYFKRIGTKVFLPSVAVELGEMLKREGEQREGEQRKSFKKMEAETGAVKSALVTAESGLGKNQAQIMEELRHERHTKVMNKGDVNIWSLPGWLSCGG